MTAVTSDQVQTARRGATSPGEPGIRRGRRSGLPFHEKALFVAPAFLVGQLCEVVDLDGPILLKTDRPLRANYIAGKISCPDAVWGGAGQRVSDPD